MAFYNENDPFAARWLRGLVAEGQVPSGTVDERSIVGIDPQEIGDGPAHFFAGIGGWAYALRLAGIADDAPVWTGSCPCQPFSTAGKRKGHADERHLWPAWFRLIRERRPELVFGEQVAGRDGLAWLDAVRDDLEDEGYAVASVVLCAAGVGAPHARQRIYFAAADTNGKGGAGLVTGAHSGEARPWGRFGEAHLQCLVDSPLVAGDLWPRPIVRKVDDGVPARVGRLRGYGNAIVAPLAAEFVRAFMETLAEPPCATYPEGR